MSSQRMMTDTPRRASALPKGGLSRIRELAAAGARQEDLAHAMGLSVTTWRRVLEREPRAAAALEAGRGELYARMVGFITNPKLEGGGSVTERVALMRAKHTGCMMVLNSLFGWRQAQEPEAARLSVEIKLPGPMSPDQYRASIPGTAERVDGA